MAGLTRGELEAKTKYHKPLLAKAKLRSANVALTDGKKVSLYGATLTYKNNMKKEVSVDLSTVTANEFPKHVKDGTTGHTIVLENGTSFTMGKLLKSDDMKGLDKDESDTPDEKGGDKKYPHDFNRGGVAEGIYAAAIFLRFTNKGKKRGAKITEKELKDFIMNKMAGEGNSGTIEGIGDNREKTIKDDIILDYGLKAADAKSLYDKRIWEHWKGAAVKLKGIKQLPKQGSDMVQTALNYVNNASKSSAKTEMEHPIIEWAHIMWDNGVYNEVRINAEGEVAQDETKVDIRVSANNHNGADVDLKRISLKYNGVGQFGQMSGVTWDVTAGVLKEFFAIDDPRLSEDDYIGFIKTKDNKSDAALAMRKMWEAECGVTEAGDRLSDSLKTKKGAKAFQNALWRHMSQGKTAKKDEPGVELVDAYKDDPIVYQLDGLFDHCFHSLELKSEYSLSQVSKRSAGKNVPGMDHTFIDLCKIDITAKGLGTDADSRKTLITIRIKRGDSNAKGPYYRTIFEKKELLHDLIAAGKREYDPKYRPDKN